jgi:hypothetical protein
MLNSQNRASAISGFPKLRTTPRAIPDGETLAGATTKQPYQMKVPPM